MTPDDAAILLAGAFSITAYLLWVSEHLRAVRGLLALLAVVAVVLSLVLHDLEVSRAVSGAAPPDVSDLDAAAPPADAS